MALSKELLQLLDDKDEPLAKRLQIADNAFKSELPLRRKEALLFKWLSKTTKEHDKNSWELLLSWLKSPHVQNLSRIDISLDELQNLVNIITKRYSHEEHTVIITDCLLEIVQNKTFQLFFKCDVSWYCKFVTTTLLKIQCREQLDNFLTNDQLFHRLITSSDNFHLHFLQNTLPVLGKISLKFKDRQVFLNISKLIDKCLFRRNFGVFSAYFKSIFDGDRGDHELPSLLFEALTEADSELYKVVFHSFCASYDNFSVIYSFFGMLLQVLGFNVSSFFKCELLPKFAESNKDVSVVSGFYEILSEKTYDLSLQVNGKTFIECLEYLLCDAFDNVEPCAEMYEFLNKTTALHPLLLKMHLDKVLVYVFNDKSNAEEREIFLLGLFDVFAKLHRTSALINSMIVTVKENEFVDAVDIPQKVFAYFSQCVTTLASWQILEMHKSFLLHLDDAVASMDNASYIDFTSTFLGKFMKSLRMAEHTVPGGILDNFMKSMMELKDILKKFGTKLVRLEHNPRLMRSYLNLCLTWGDLYIVLVYYSNDYGSFQSTIDNDYSATNITYLHSYLNRDQWRLISQRIANFGEKPCKQIMQNLCVQKLRAMQLFENSISSDVLTPVAANILISLDEQDEDLLFNPFVLNNIIFPNCEETSAKVLVKRIVAHNDSEKLHLLCENSYTIGRVLYVLLYRLNKAFGKHNRSESLTSKLLSTMKANLFELTNLSTLTETFAIRNDFRFSTDEGEIKTYLDLIKTIPLAQFEDRIVLEIVFAYMVALMVDLKKCDLEDSSLLEKCEDIITGIAQSLKLSRNVILKNTVQLIIENLNKYDTVFNFCLQSLFRNNQKGSINDILDLIAQNLNQDRYMRCACIFLEYLDRFKNSKLSEDLKRHREEMYEQIIAFVQVHDRIKIERLTEAFAFVLKWYLFNNTEGHLEMLLPYLDGYIEVIANSDDHIKGAVLLLSVFVKNKTKCLTSKSTITKVWVSIHRLKINEEQNSFTKLVALTLQHIPEDEFSESCSKLLTTTEESMTTGHFNDQLKLWTAISSANLNNAQTKTWHNTLEFFIYRKILPRLQRNKHMFAEQLIQLELVFLENGNLPLSASLLEAVLMTVSLTATAEPERFVDSFNLNVLLLESLVKNRKTLVADFLPMYLQRYRTLLNHLCENSNSEKKLSPDNVQNVADCAHKFEKLTKALVSYDRALSRISPYVMADILKQFEQFTIYANVKIHLNNCLYNFLSLCDEHAVAYLKRALSTASTEMFKVIYENYNKYYKFTGKV